PGAPHAPQDTEKPTSFPSGVAWNAGMTLAKASRGAEQATSESWLPFVAAPAVAVATIVTSAPTAIQIRRMLASYLSMLSTELIEITRRRRTPSNRAGSVEAGW